ncbi:MAG: hypothetical protein C0602_12920 [Denitrovibrio sp.]|nr:MAG: hypothetical protein C0602_12920 [Denitrovibrio sp.]
MTDTNTKKQWVDLMKKAIDIIENDGDRREISNLLVSMLGAGICDFNCMVTNAQFFQNVLDLIPTPVYYKDLYGVYIGCNEAMARLHGMKKSEIIGRKTADIYTKEESEIFSYSDTVLINEQSHEMVEHKGRFTTLGGAYHILHKKLIQNPDGTPAGVLGFISDVSEIKQNEERAWQSEAFYKSLFDNSPRPKIIYNEFNIVEDMNQAAVAFFGGHTNLVGGDVMSIYDHYEDCEKVMASGGKSVKINIKKDKDSKPMEALATLTVSSLESTEKYAVSFLVLETVL